MFRIPAPMLAASALLASAAAGAARADDLQAWPTIQATGPVRADGLAVWADSQLRINDDIGRVLQKNARLGLGKEWKDGRSFYGGWAWLQTTPLGAGTNNEHRIWEQLGYPVLSRGRWRVTGRMRLEQRRREGAPDTAWRMRQMLRATYRLGGEGSPSLLAHSEFFTEFADTRWGVHARGYDQVRSFAGVRLPVNRKLAVETGYFNQSFGGSERGGPNHIWLTSLAFTW